MHVGDVLGGHILQYAYDVHEHVCFFIFHKYTNLGPAKSYELKKYIQDYKHASSFKVSTGIGVFNAFS